MKRVVLLKLIVISFLLIGTGFNNNSGSNPICNTQAAAQTARPNFSTGW
jgi:hypothetical protein